MVAAAALAAARRRRAYTNYLKFLETLAARVHTMAPLSPEEMAAPAYADVVEAMDRRFSERLSIATPALEQPSKPQKPRTTAASGCR